MKTNKFNEKKFDRVIIVIIVFVLFLIGIFLFVILYPDFEKKDFKITKEECKIQDKLNYSVSIKDFIQRHEIKTSFSLAGLEEVNKSFFLEYNADRLDNLNISGLKSLNAPKVCSKRNFESSYNPDCLYEDFLRFGSWGESFNDSLLRFDNIKVSFFIFNNEMIKIDGSGIREYNGKIKNLRYDKNDINVTFLIDEYSYPTHKEKFCEQVEVEKIIFNCLEDEKKGISCNEGGGIFQKEALTIKWLDDNAECIEYYPNAKCSKYRVGDYFVEVLE